MCRLTAWLFVLVIVTQIVIAQTAPEPQTVRECLTAVRAPRN